VSGGTRAVVRDAARHKAPRPDLVGRALRRALVATVVPAVLLGIAGWITVRQVPGRIVDVVVDPTALGWAVVGIGVVWALWVLLIWRTYALNRLRPAPRPLRIAGGAAVFLMCVAVTAPMALGARYAVVQRDLIASVFADEDSVTTPEVTAENPWGDRRRVNVLLLGGDGAVHRPGVRTDSVMLASIDTRTGKTVLFSLPRNLRDVPFPAGSKLAALYPDGFSGTGDDAEYFLNAVYRNIPALHPGILGHTDNEGADAVKLAVSATLGIRVDYYVLVNLGGFRQLVDAIGGITVNINEPVAIGGNTDAGIPPDDYLQPGPDQRLDGFQALWFTRGRYGSTDYKRMERQRCAINAIVAEADPVTVLRRYTGLAKASKHIVRTDIPRKLLPAFVDLAAKVKGERITSVGFERSAEFDPNAPDFDYVRHAVQAALHPAPARRSVEAAGPPASTGSAGTSTKPARIPSRASDATDDCAYRPAVSAGSSID
jgi:LCP family protein required for cell wall assembly